MPEVSDRRAGNFVSEWFGHRVFPVVVSSEQSVLDQRGETCPFLTAATKATTNCIKAESARGVCSISSNSNRVRQDWLVCPYRALSDELVSNSIRQLFLFPTGSPIFIAPAASLVQPATREGIEAALEKNVPVFIYFDKKTGGELSIPATAQSPEFSFDVTVVELVATSGVPHIGRFGVLEIQTMDFHGSYRSAVRNLREALRMHPDSFASTVQLNQWWLADGVEGPNIANVFKRTFYQMMFKFQLGHHERCAGCVLAIPQSVWDSWQNHLGSPSLASCADGTYRLAAPGREIVEPCPAWIYVFEPDASSTQTPSPVNVNKVIGTDAQSISYWALEVAPAAALSNVDAAKGFLAGLSRRLNLFWPELAHTVLASLPTGDRRAVRDAPIEKFENESSYSGPTSDAIKGEEPDE